MTRICLMVMYYGEFPPNFLAWLKTVEYNSSVDFLLITDNLYKKQLPKNVILKNISFENIKKMFQEKFEFRISLDTTYKLCDFKPAYGYIFEEEIKDYDFWGCCDLDQIFGDIRKFLTDDILARYDVVGFLGHFTLYRNNEQLRYLFQKGGCLYNYKEVFSNSENYAFDEITGMLQLVLRNQIRHYYPAIYGDMRASRRIQLTSYTIQMKTYDKQIFYWYNGSLYQAYIENGNIKCKEFMYFHFSKKKPKVNWKTDTIESFILYASNFVQRDSIDVTIEEIEKCAEKKRVIYERIERLYYYIKQFKKLLISSKKQKTIWINQKKFKRKMIKPVFQENN